MVSRYAFMLAVFTLLASSFSLGQKSASDESSPRFELFAGYSLLAIDSGGLNRGILDVAFATPSGTFGSPTRFNGFNGELQFKATRMLGVVADFSGNYGKLFTANSSSNITGLPRVESYSALVGPVVSLGKSNEVVPFLHALFGLNRLESSSTTTLAGLPFTSLPSSTDTAFAMAFGGGLDLNITPRLGVRLAQIDYLYTGHDMNTFAENIFQSGTFTGLAKRENNVRLSAGITFRF